MLQIWRRLIDILISLLVPPLSDKPLPSSSTSAQVSPQEMDVIFKWLQLLKAFFNAKESDGVEHGVPIAQLQSGPYKDIIVLGQYLDLPTPVLKERAIAAVKAAGRSGSISSSSPSSGAGINGAMRGLSVSKEEEEERLAEVLLRIVRTR